MSDLKAKSARTGEHEYFEWDQPEETKAWLVERIRENTKYRIRVTWERQWGEVVHHYDVCDLKGWKSFVEARDGTVEVKSVSKPTVAILAHSWGVPSSQNIVDEVAGLSENLVFVALDAVGSRGGVIADATFDVSGSGFESENVYYVNVYSYDFGDTIRDLPVPVVNGLLGGLWSGVSGLFGGGGFANGLATGAGDRHLFESGADVNMQVDMPHWDTYGFFKAAWGDPGLSRALGGSAFPVDPWPWIR